jgi:hypothetical protein
MSRDDNGYKEQNRTKGYMSASLKWERINYQRFHHVFSPHNTKIYLSYRHTLSQRIGDEHV